MMILSKQGGKEKIQGNQAVKTLKFAAEL